MKDYYKILNLPFGASLLDVKRAYRKLAFQFHPDKNQNDLIAEERFKEITEAYSVLSDSEKAYLYRLNYIEYKTSVRPSLKQSAKQGKYPYDYRDIPRPATGKASDRSIHWNVWNVGAIIIFISLIIFMLVSSFREIKERESIIHNRISGTSNDSVVVKKKYKMTKDEYYNMLAQEFTESKDSTLYKIKNIDSMMQVIDSLNILNQ